MYRNTVIYFPEFFPEKNAFFSGKISGKYIYHCINPITLKSGRNAIEFRSL